MGHSQENLKFFRWTVPIKINWKIKIPGNVLLLNILYASDCFQRFSFECSIWRGGLHREASLLFWREPQLYWFYITWASSKARDSIPLIFYAKVVQQIYLRVVNFGKICWVWNQTNTLHNEGGIFSDKKSYSNLDHDKIQWGV